MALPNIRHEAAQLAEYGLALVRHWKAGVTGGIVTSVLTAWVLAGGKIAVPIGVGFVVGMVVVASFRAWSDEHVGRQVAAQVTRFRWATLDDHKVAVVGVRLINKGRRPVSFDPEWILEVWSVDGQEVARLPGTIQMPRVDDALEPMEEAAQYNVQMVFPEIESAADLGARYVISGTDIYGHPVTVRYPAM